MLPCCLFYFVQNKQYVLNVAYSTVFLDTPLDPKKRKRCAFIVVGGGGSADVVAVKLYFFVVHLFEVAVKLYFDLFEVWVV